MIRPEDVDAELVEKAARARISAQHGRPLTDAEWSAVRSRIEEVWIASTLAAVLPDIQAEALEPVMAAHAEHRRVLTAGGKHPDREDSCHCLGCVMYRAARATKLA